MRMGCDYLRGRGGSPPPGKCVGGGWMWAGRAQATTPPQFLVLPVL